MLLTIDIGNTNITIGTFRYEPGKPAKGPLNVWRLHTDHEATADEYGPKILDLFHYGLLDASMIKGVAIANVVPALNAVFEEMADRYFHTKAFFVTSETSAIVPNRYGNPAEVGADRLADAAAAYAFFGGPAIIIDFGTATTFDCIGKGGEYYGGVIAPGPAISAESLARRTAKLPRVEMIKPAKVIGASTVQSIQSGLYFGYVGLTREIIQQLKRELRGSPRIIATGGLAHLIVPEIKEVKSIVPELTLEGIRIIWESQQ